MKIRRMILAASVLTILSAVDARADHSAMSQLDFDQPSPVIEGPSKEVINTILETSSEKNAKQDDSKKSSTESRARLAAPTQPEGVEKFDWIKSDDATSSFLTPRLKGPALDKDSVNTITTEISWKKEGASCQDVKSPKQMNIKARALMEVMNRFSGNDDFYKAQCTQSCGAEDQAAALTAFAVKSVSEGEFKMIEDKNKTCRYQIKSNAIPPRWQMLEGERGTCTCLPKGIL